MRKRDDWWAGTVAMLIVCNVVLVYWVVCETFGWMSGALLGDVLYWLTFFVGMFLSPVAAVLGVRAAAYQARSWQFTRSAVIAFLSGGALMCAWVSWNAILTGGR